jgi:hypothetical protein
MSRLLRLALAAAAAALAGLLARRLLLQPGHAGSLPRTAEDSADSPPRPLGGREPTVSPTAVRDAARSLPGTRAELYKQAAGLGIKGRSKMNKRQLHEAVQKRR